MKHDNNDSVIMTVDEVAEYLKLSKITVYKLTQKGEIPGFRIGSSWRYNRETIDEIGLVLREPSGEPAEGVEVIFDIEANGHGASVGGERRRFVLTDAEGRATTSWRIRS